MRKLKSTEPNLKSPRANRIPQNPSSQSSPLPSAVPMSRAATAQPCSALAEEPCTADTSEAHSGQGWGNMPQVLSPRVGTTWGPQQSVSRCGAVMHTPMQHLPLCCPSSASGLSGASGDAPGTRQRTYELLRTPNDAHFVGTSM